MIAWQPINDWVLWQNVDAVAVVRLAIMVLCAVCGAMMSALYLKHKVGTMPGLAAVGMVGLLTAILMASARQLGASALYPDSVLLLVSLVAILVSILGRMWIGLFRRHRKDGKR